MSRLDLVKLTGLTEVARGQPEIAIGLIDGPVAVDHPDLPAENIRPIPGEVSRTCARPASAACLHGTFVAGILSAKRDSRAPPMCPGCTLLLRPIFPETTPTNGQMPSATRRELEIEAANSRSEIAHSDPFLTTE
jgi:subtilisin family serine protease